MTEIPKVLPRLYDDLQELLNRVKNCPYDLSKNHSYDSLASELQGEIKSKSINFSMQYINTLIQDKIRYCDTTLILESIEKARDLVKGNNPRYDEIESKLALAAQMTVQEKGLEGLSSRFAYLLTIDPSIIRK